MKIRLTSVYDYPHHEFVELLRGTESFRFITWPILSFQPASGIWPERWEIGRDVFRFRLFGILPVGSQQISISNPSNGFASDGSVVLRDDGSGTLMQRWDHWITTKSLGDNQTLYVDEVEVHARYLPLVFTPFCALFALAFYAHRQRRWKKYLLHKKHPQCNAGS
ncbi:hypothetical protein [Variovorax sp. PCZ-1]|uniref:hypothetical protein n=1 Tax=Variovorax sp. PCZ-1 TaxID=2835533 RepID=UPI001BCE5198|nr:hypothetical protein [Variovorax sp. PCZ-1]MBS7808600.1 hypothetical protein [Variovorax sp. PCZ-1]